MNPFDPYLWLVTMFLGLYLYIFKTFTLLSYLHSFAASLLPPLPVLLLGGKKILGRV